jgi:hypothetical protein
MTLWVFFGVDVSVSTEFYHENTDHVFQLKHLVRTALSNIGDFITSQI